MKITHLQIYDFEESIVASGLPMMTEYDEKWTAAEIKNLRECENITDNPHFKRARSLASNPPGSGHCNFLSGITVAMNVTATNVWWMQMERYHFVQIVSSQSKMHRLKEMLKSDNVEKFFHPKTHPSFVMANSIINNNGSDIESLVYSCCGGLELTARITTNYLQLKTIWSQRHNHRLSEWRDFCDEISRLPFAEEFIIGAERLVDSGEK